jgi:hypothetical protein
MAALNAKKKENKTIEAEHWYYIFNRHQVITIRDTTCYRGCKARSVSWCYTNVVNSHISSICITEQLKRIHQTVELVIRADAAQLKQKQCKNEYKYLHLMYSRKWKTNDIKTLELFSLHTMLIKYIISMLSFNRFIFFFFRI